MSIGAKEVKELRNRTGAGIMDCKGALTEADGDIEKAIEILRTKGLAKAAKKAGRIVSEGLVGSYIHAGGKIGVLVEINCETDFVAKTDDFKQFVKDIAMHIAASSPQYVKREEVPEEVKEKERKIYETQAKEAGKPEKIIDKIVTGKLDKFLSEICLLEQPFIKDPDKTINDLLQETIAKLGENISIRRFVRYQLCEGLEEEIA
jgi:elongation factor Ts